MQLQTFGIEIRKIGDVKSLYQEVDLVLSKNEIKENVSAIVIKQTAAHALHRLLRVENYFDICAIDSLCKACQICIPTERYQIYRSIHCMYWNEMLPDYRQLIVAMLLDDFRCVFVK